MDTLSIKQAMKKRKPVFTRQDNHKKRLAPGWRKPKGCHSKMRHKIKGYKRNVTTGYGTPRQLRHTDLHGKTIRTIANVEDMLRLPKECVVIIARTVGMQKRKLLLDELHKKRINMHVTTIEQEQEKISAALKKKQEKKTEEKTEKKEDKPVFKKEHTAVSEEEKKQQAKKEMDKALIHTD
ncbi:MAG: eL32 family ribosomal protein [archaeon]